ncbi:MAG: BNR-4 repeat-containing protein [Planctomycetota bacterium]
MDQAPGYQGVWYGNQPTDDALRWKYSGGLATYPQQHEPIAIYRGEVDRTYFVYGGAGDRPAGMAYRPQGREADGTTACCIGYYDHKRGVLSRPVVLWVRDVIDAHENPVLCIDRAGHLLVFCPSHGAKRASRLYRSVEPHDLSSFEVIASYEAERSFSYPQPWWIDGVGVVLLHTRYDGSKRRLAISTSPDGMDWSDWDRPEWLSRLGEGSYQVSWRTDHGAGGKLATAFDLHPATEGDMPLNRRTNLYYLESADGGASWQTAEGTAVELPVVDEASACRVLDGAAAGVLVYLKNVSFDGAGRPVVVYLTSGSAWPKEDSGPHRWRIARYDGADVGWSHHAICESDHNYDHGELLILSDDDWRLIIPSDPGPQRRATGGGMCLWRSADRGTTWQRDHRVVEPEGVNHTYARRVFEGSDDFAFLWASANAHDPGPVDLWFADREGKTRKMPRTVGGDFTEPETVVGHSKEQSDA